MPNLKVDFTLDGSTLTAKIIEQDESLRGKGDLWTDGTYAIYSLICPAMYNKVLYLCGSSRGLDEEEFSRTYASAAEALAAKTAFERGIAEINGENVTPGKGKRTCELTDCELDAMRVTRNVWLNVIRNTMMPGEVFPEDRLRKWAEENGFSKPEEEKVD